MTSSRLVTAIGITAISAIVLTIPATSRLGIASIYNALGDVQMSEWPRHPERIASELPSTRASLSLGHAIYPANPDILVNLAGLSRYAGYASAAKTDSVHERNALSFYREASRIRPGDALIWANIAESKAILDEVDSEFIAAMESASRLGPFEPQVQYLTLNAGLRVYPSLSAPLRSEIMKIALRGALSLSPGQNRKILDLANNFGYLALVCPSLPRSGIFPRYCQPR